MPLPGSGRREEARKKEEKRKAAEEARSVKTALMKFAEFQEVAHRRYDFKDIDLKFYNEYTSWLKVVDKIKGKYDYFD